MKKLLVFDIPFAIVCSMLIIWTFVEMNKSYINIWDEALYANNALYMRLNHDWLNYYNYGVIDYHNSKPPLALWMQVFAFNLFGVSEFSVRITTYCALVILCISIIYWMWKETNSYKPGLICTFLIASSKSLMQKHVFLTGDLDGLLILFETLLILFIVSLSFREKAEYKRKDYFIALMLFLLCWFTKSTSVLLWGPSLTIILLTQNRLTTFVKNKYFLLFSFVSLFIIFIYYATREYKSPGYWNIVWSTEFVRIAVNPQPWFDWKNDFYYSAFQDYENSLSYLIIPSFLALLFTKKGKIRRLSFSLIIAGLVFGLVISFSPSKMAYYAAPFYPILYIALSLCWWQIFVALKEFFGTTKMWFQLACFTFTLTILTFRISKFLEYLPPHIKTHVDLENEIYLFNKLKNKINPEDSLIFFRRTDPKFRHHNDALEFYVLKNKFSDDIKLLLKDSLRSGNYAIISNPLYFDAAKAEYKFQVLDSTDIGVLVKVK